MLQEQDNNNIRSLYLDQKFTGSSEEKMIIRSVKKCKISNVIGDDDIFEENENNSTNENKTNSDINKMSDITEWEWELNAFVWPAICVAW